MSLADSQAEQLLFLLARCRLSSAQEAWLDQTVAELKEPQRFEDLATRTFLAPMAYFHLSRSKGQAAPPEMMARLHAQRLHTAGKYLFLKSEANLLSANLLEPLGIMHAFFKGTAYADQFYQDPTLRKARDIDVLIPRKSLASVVERGLSLGYQLYDEDAIMTTEERAFYLTIADEISLRSPQGAHIEVHTQLDKSGVIFDTSIVMSQTEACEGSDFRRKLPDWLHLIYVCLHHTRHRWSHMHWLSDLDAAMSSPGYDIARVKAEAIRLGVWQCVEPCLMLQDVSGRPEAIAAILEGTSDASSEVQDLVKASSTNLGRRFGHLSGGSGVLMISDFFFSWQMSASFRMRYCKWLLRRVSTPRLEDYRSSPLGQRIPVVLLVVHVARALGWRLRRLVRTLKPTPG